ncbi:MAG: hypothetical protein AB7P76_05800 [Candidatus Melainabacteria bacterium]
MSVQAPAVQSGNAPRFGKATPEPQNNAAETPAPSQQIRELIPPLVDRVELLAKAVEKNPQDQKAQETLARHLDNVLTLQKLVERLRRLEIASAVSGQVEGFSEEWISPLFTRLGITVKNEK